MNLILERSDAVIYILTADAIKSTQGLFIWGYTYGGAVVSVLQPSDMTRKILGGFNVYFSNMFSRY